MQLVHIYIYTISYTNSCGIVMYLLEETIVTLGEVVMDGSNISDIVAPHIPYPSLLYLSHPISKGFGPKHPKSNKSLCILFLLNHDIALSVVIYTIVTGRIELSSDGKGIDKFFVLIIYTFQEHRNICKSPGRGGGILCYQSPGPEPYHIVLLAIITYYVFLLLYIYCIYFLGVTGRRSLMVK